ncbi:MAG: hypothetical protein K2R98_27935 [Gemmataceae bacterium]|nr:hypothetical protein [Gemmataceae bacterium]
MTESEWLACDQPDLLLEVVEGKATRAQLVEFVRRCWQHVTPFLPPVQSELTVVEQFAAVADRQSDHDAVLYAAEAALKLARWAPDMRQEQRQQAALLRQIVGRPA